MLGELPASTIMPEISHESFHSIVQPTYRVPADMTPAYVPICMQPRMTRRARQSML